MSPKELFLANQLRASEHQKTFKAFSAQESLLAAFNQFCWELPGTETPSQSWAANARRQGAREFIAILLSLGDPPVKRTPTQAGKLEEEDASSNASPAKQRDK